MCVFASFSHRKFQQTFLFYMETFLTENSDKMQTLLFKGTVRQDYIDRPLSGTVQWDGALFGHQLMYDFYKKGLGSF
jgi:hypothetical protein